MTHRKSNSKLANKMKWMLAAVLLAVPAMAQQGIGLALAQQAAGETRKRQIVVSIPDRKLALLEDGAILKVYRVAVGARVSPSPTGQFVIANRVVEPTYYHAGTVIESGPRNPLGTRWMGLTQKGYGIHGTNEPRSIGKAASHGCIRMAQADLEELFEMVRVGDTVEISAAADTQTAQIFGQSAVPQSTTVLAQAQPAAGVAGGQ
jgi:lipoprotein-anchoring transpeptidase ErfK/SrfK